MESSRTFWAHFVAIWHILQRWLFLKATLRCFFLEVGGTPGMLLGLPILSPGFWNASLSRVSYVPFICSPQYFCHLSQHISPLLFLSQLHPGRTVHKEAYFSSQPRVVPARIDQVTYSFCAHKKRASKENGLYFQHWWCFLVLTGRQLLLGLPGLTFVAGWQEASPVSSSGRDKGSGGSGLTQKELN